MIKSGFSILFLLIPLIFFAQEYTNPNFALASHPMKVVKINLQGKEMVVELSIENQSETGSFCADKNIYIQDILGKKKYQLIKSQGIPVCPSSYNFQFVGEVLNFRLYFPKPDPGVKYLDLVENCDQYCFSINGIILDAEMNKNINLGYDYYKKGKLDFALVSFKMAVDSNKDYPYGFIYLNIVQILVEKNDIATAKLWYKKLTNSSFSDKNELLDRIKKEVYYQKLIQ